MSGSEIHLGLNKIKTREFWRAIGAECFGQALLLLILITAALSWNEKVDASANIVKISFAVGFGITILIMAIDHVSGAHLNPAVTAGMMVAGRISVIQGVLYIIAQCVGATIGSALVYGLTNEKTRGSLAVPKLHENVNEMQGFGSEFLFTFILVFVIFSMLDKKKKYDVPSCALAIGITVVVVHLSGIPLTSCSLNPARAFGPSLVMNDFDDYHWLYWIAPLLGGIFASFAYNFLFFVADQTTSKENENQELQSLNTNEA